MAKILSIVAPEKFQQIEYLESKKALEEKGHEVMTASLAKTATDKLGEKYKVNMLLSEVNVKDFDAILFVGGPGSHALFDNKQCHQLAKEFYKVGKLTTAICAAPVILGRAGLLKGKKVTCWPAQKDDIQKTDALYTSVSIEKDGLIITADGPDSAHDFGLALSEALT